MPVATFDDVLGQSAAVSTLVRAHAADRLPHGLVFAGPAGVGKALTARALGALLLCPQAEGSRPCGTCASCTLMSAGTHPDFHNVYRQLSRLEKESAKARDLTIDVIRDYLVAPANLKATLNHGKIFVVEEADRMNVAAQNSMLKTLEEPAGRTVIILLTDQPNSLLQTIRSRCQIITFSPLTARLVQEQLVQRGMDESKAAAAADLSEGSLGLALRWIEDGVVASAGELHEHLAALCAGRTTAQLQAWFKGAADAYAKRQQQRDPLVSIDQVTREGLGLYLRLGALYFRRRLADESDAETLDRFCCAIELLNRTENLLDANVAVPVALLQLSVSLHQTLVPAPAAMR